MPGKPEMQYNSDIDYWVWKVPKFAPYEKKFNKNNHCIQDIPKSVNLLKTGNELVFLWILFFCYVTEKLYYQQTVKKSLTKYLL